MTQTDSPDKGILRRHFVAIATSTYDDPGWDELPVDDEVDALSGWLVNEALDTRAEVSDGLCKRWVLDLKEIDCEHDQDHPRRGRA